MRLLSPAIALSLCVLASCKSERTPSRPAAQPSQSGPQTVSSAPVVVDETPPSGGVVPIATTHPRIWITPADLPRLRSWASSKNPVWESGIAVALKQAIATYDKDFYPGGQANPNWPETGIDNWVGKTTEAYAEFFAFASLVDPDPAQRPIHATRAKNLLMHVIREAAKGPDPDRQKPAPFRGPAFATYNRASYWGEGFGLTVDWIYSTLSAEEKGLIRKVFMRWSDELLHAATAGEEHPQPIGVMNDKQLLADKKRLRWSINNYFTGHMRQLVFYGLSLDAADDPPIDAAAPAGKIGNTLHSYLDDAIGAWLYQQYAVYEDASVVGPAYGVAADNLGMASGGLSPEGFLYGASVGMMHEALFALFTAGYRDPKSLGPQIRLIDSAFWDRVTDGMLSSMTPEPGLVPNEAYVGNVYQVANYGDSLRNWVTPDHATAYLTLAMHSAATGNKKRLDRARWIAINAVEGTSTALTHRIADIWGNSGASISILYFLALDPALSAPPDPRPSMPLAFFDKPIGRLIARSDWTPSQTMFDYKCTYNTISHQLGDCNQFEMYRKGEWLVRERSGYANDLWVATSEYHNTLAIQNQTPSGGKPTSLQWFEGGTWERGGQFIVGTNAGDPTVRVSSGPGWAHAQGDATPLYNRASSQPSDAAMDVVHASRSIAWLAPDFIVVYDRATTKSDKRFKRFHIVSGGDPEVKGPQAIFTTPKGQKLYVQTLLPTTAVLTATKAETFDKVAEGEPSRSKLMVQDPAGPANVRFLHVFQGADATAAAIPPIAIASSAGTPFAGAAVGSFAAVFPVDLAATFAKVTYSVPATVKSQLVSGLVPGASYDVAFKTVGANIEVTVTPGAAYKADDGGVIALGTFAAKK